MIKAAERPEIWRSPARLCAPDILVFLVVRAPVSGPKPRRSVGSRRSLGDGDPGSESADSGLLMKTGDSGDANQTRPRRRDRRRHRLAAGNSLSRGPAARRGDLRERCLRPAGDARASPQADLQGIDEDHRRRRAARTAGRRRRGLDHEGLGDGAGRDPLHPLVPAPHRVHRREARRDDHPRGRREHRHPIQRGRARPRGARRVEFPLRGPARHVRGPRLHSLGPDQPRVHHPRPKPRHALRPDRLRLLDGRSSRQEDAAPPLDRRPEHAGAPHPEALRDRRGCQQGQALCRDRAGVLPRRSAPVLRPPRSGYLRAHALRCQTPEGTGTRRPLLRRHPPAGDCVHGRG